jgi:TRAP-type C4-dicarboxylate transport system permease small subunit
MLDKLLKQDKVTFTDMICLVVLALVIIYGLVILIRISESVLILLISILIFVGIPYIFIKGSKVVIAEMKNK